MNDDIKYIGNFTNDEIENRSGIKSSKEKKNKEFKINKTNLKVKQFISSTKTKIINKKVINNWCNGISNYDNFNYNSNYIYSKANIFFKSNFRHKERILYAT